MKTNLLTNLCILYLIPNNCILNAISGGLSAGDIVGIVFGVIAGTALLAVVGVLLIYKLRLDL